jgi:uncharacterized flavoprotein (TIGR03862 family)
MVAETLAKRGLKVSIYDHKPSPARKFLMAGRGGLNITHSEPLEIFITRYGEASNFLRPMIENFTPQDMRDWCHELGEETFIGTSGRVFPKNFKASPLLRAWLKRLEDLGVKFHFNFKWTGQDMNSDITILALGGASWPRLGSDGNWLKILSDKNILVHPFRPANSGFVTTWSDVFSTKFQGQPLKNIALTHQDITIQGEIMITRNGVEGGGIYALSKSIRKAIEQNNSTHLNLDLKPSITIDNLVKKLSVSRGRESFSNHLRKIGLSPVAIGLLQEDRNISALSPIELANRIKSCPINLTGVAGIERAISSAGGIALDEVDNNLMLKKWPNTYVAGEMLDWEASTGGYLLQACFSMAVWLGKNIP